MWRKAQNLRSPKLEKPISHLTQWRGGYKINREAEQ